MVYFLLLFARPLPGEHTTFQSELQEILPAKPQLKPGQHTDRQRTLVRGIRYYRSLDSAFKNKWQNQDVYMLDTSDMSLTKVED